MDADPSVQLRNETAIVDLAPAAGGRIAQITLGGRRQLLRGPEWAGAGWAMWGWYPLLPWSNRIPGGIIDLGATSITVPVNWPDGSAIHGLAASVPWRVDAADAHVADLSIERHVGGYDVAGRQRIELAPTHLDQRLTVVNTGDRAVPVGLGIHPWFAAAPIRVPAAQVWPGDDGAVPERGPEAVAPDIDLRRQRVPPPMDRCFTALADANADIGDLRLSWSGPIEHVVIYSGEPGWVCVEPVTMATNAFALARQGRPGTGAVQLDPGGELTVTYRLAWPAHASADARAVPAPPRHR